MAPPTSFTRYINIARALPRDSEVARAIGCLLVLRCDLILDHYGLIEEQIPALDVIDRDYRRLFFFRANSRTLYSARWVLNRLAGLKEFRSWLSMAEPEILREWTDNKKVVDRTAGQAAAIRNAVGAHAEQDLMDAVRRIPDDQMGFIEFSDKDGERPRLAGQIVTAALLPDAKPGTEPDVLRAAFDSIGDASGALLNCIRVALNLYSKRYPLWGRD
jgi:hypothetical protein